MKTSRKIVFFVPSFSSIEATAPLGLLAISTPLLRAGYEVRIIDSTIAPDYKQRILDEVKDALCLGISVVTGPMIKDTVEAAKAVKKWNPEFPVILGGWHPSLLPTQTLEAEYVDIIVRGQGEESTLELIERLRDDAPLDDVRGIGFKQGGKIHFTPERPLKTLDQTPPKAYHLADFDAYERVCGRRWAMYVSSLACPFDCSYCTNAGVYGRKWNALPPEQVVEETIDLTRRYRLELLWMADDNFLVDLDRALKIAEGLIRAGGNFKWSIQATTNLTARLTIDQLALLRRSGMHQVCQGIETRLAQSHEAHEQRVSGPGRHLPIHGALYQGGHHPFLQYHLWISWRRRGGAPRNHQLHDGCLPALPGRGVLDQHFHPLSGLAHFSSRQGNWN